MSLLVVRDASPDEADQLSRLIQRSVRALNAKDYDSKIIDLICENFSAARIRAKMLSRDMFNCRLEERLVGTISLGGCRLHSLFVERDATSQGVGTFLVDHLERHARNKGIRELELSSSITARTFYLRCGYDQIAFEERSDGSTYLMRKSLTPP